MISSPHNIIPQRIQHVPKVNIKVETGNGFHLPPTPPSCSSSEDSEDNGTISQPPSPNFRKNLGANRVVVNSQASTRQPIHTPLISTQPVGFLTVIFHLSLSNILYFYRKGQRVRCY